MHRYLNCLGNDSLAFIVCVVEFYCDMHLPKSKEQNESDSVNHIHIDKAKHLEQLDVEFLQETLGDQGCNVHRGDCLKNQKTSFGLLTTFMNCKVIVGFDESHRAEGVRRVVRHLYRVWKNGEIPVAMLYDDACT
ncbi:unnamed protein product [Didymodactylos carnosus]|uniref:Uncharacterized protein n=1 Tax=Didymodactylos carnosus TaxID=1234261 RepID=A0A815DA22_9BILA|nr:unnamed protein product [Didymodactylos carnosus]CAF1298752.1 unnamed protein product [Didymodactylos carnosus]CAF3669710.1 unnamed protein product [Didymodactylos carnosus]CAF4118584.1 unnamed protein product [Didymodactylos carnosus]